MIIGGLGAGHVAKLINNLLIALAGKLGVNLDLGRVAATLWADSATSRPDAADFNRIAERVEAKS